MKNNLFLPDTSVIPTMMDNEEGVDIVENILRTKKSYFLQLSYLRSITRQFSIRVWKQIN